MASIFCSGKARINLPELSRMAQKTQDFPGYGDLVFKKLDPNSLPVAICSETSCGAFHCWKMHDENYFHFAEYLSHTDLTAEETLNR